MYCPACGALNEETATFCGSCGTTLGGEPRLPESGVEAAQETLAEVSAGLEQGREAAAQAVAGVDAAQEGLHQPLPEESGMAAPPAEVVPRVPSPAVAPRPPAPPAPPRGHASVYTAPASSAPTSGLAIASLILSIGGLSFLPFLGSIVGVILGYMARSDIRRRPEQVSGDGMALVGLILGWLGIGLTVLAGLFFGAIALCSLVGVFGSFWQMQ